MSERENKKLELLRLRFSQNRETITALMCALDSRLDEDLVHRFFMNPLSLKDDAELMKGGADYYEIAKQVAKAICRGSKVVCPYVDNLP